MIIEGNETEIKGTVQKVFGFKKNLPVHSGKNTKIKIIVLVKKHADIMEIVKSALRSIGLIRNTFLTVCGLLSMQRSNYYPSSPNIRLLMKSKRHMRF